MSGQRVRHFLSLLERSKTRHEHPDERLAATVDAVARSMSCEVATLYVYDGVDCLVLAATRGLARAGIGFVLLRIGEGVSGTAARNRAPVAIADVHHSEQFKVIAGFDQSRYRSILAVPLVHEDRLVGVLNVQTVQARQYDLRDIADLGAMAASIAPALAAAWRDEDLALRLRGPSLLAELTGLLAFAPTVHDACRRVAEELCCVLPGSDVAVAIDAGNGVLHTVGTHLGAAAQAAIADRLRADAAASPDADRGDPGGRLVPDPSGNVCLVPFAIGDATHAIVVRGRVERLVAAPCRPFLAEVASRLSVAMERLQQPGLLGFAGEVAIRSQLADLVLSDVGLDGLVDVVASACGGPVVVLDPFGGPIAGSFVGDAVHRHELRSGEQQLGFLVGGAHCQEAVLRASAQAIALELAKWKVRFEVESKLRGDILELIVAGDTDGAELTARARLTGLDLARRYRPVAVHLTEGDSAGRASFGWQGMVRCLHRALGDAPRCVSFARPEGVLLLVDATVDLDGLRSGISHALREFRSLSAGELAATGIGPVCELPAHYSMGVRKAKLAARLARRLGVTEPLDSSDLGVDMLLVSLADERDLRSYVDDQLGALLSADGRRSGELVRTLEALFLAGHSLRRAAGLLYVHVNTLKYRVARIETLTGRSLANPSQALDLHVALHALRLLEPSRTSLLDDEVGPATLSAAADGGPRSAR